MTPEAKLPAMPSAAVSGLLSSPFEPTAATVAPNVPHTAVACHRAVDTPPARHAEPGHRFVAGDRRRYDRTDLLARRPHGAPARSAGITADAG